MTAPEDSRTPRDPQDPPNVDPVGPSAPGAPPEPATTPPPATEPAQPPAGPEATPTENRASEAEESRGGAGQKVTALLSGAAALANKVRTEAPKKIREAREKWVAGQFVILTEVDGEAVAVGPYRNDHAAHQDIARVSGAPRVVALLTRTAYFGSEDDENSAGVRP